MSTEASTSTVPERASFPFDPRYEQLRRKRAAETSGKAKTKSEKTEVATPGHQMDFFGTAAASTKPERLPPPPPPPEPETILATMDELRHAKPEPPPEVPVKNSLEEIEGGAYTFTYERKETIPVAPVIPVAGTLRDKENPALGRIRFYDQYQNQDRQIADFLRSQNWNQDFPDLAEQFDNFNPVPASGGIALVKVAGTSHRFVGCRSALNALESGQSTGEILLVPEPDNKVDAFAIKIVDALTQEQLGYVPKEVNQVFLNSMNEGKFMGGYIMRLNADMDRQPPTSALVILGWNK